MDAFSAFTEKVMRQKEEERHREKGPDFMADKDGNVRFRLD